MKQTFKTLALITLIGGSLTACNSNDQVATNTKPVVDMSDPAEPKPTPKPGLSGTASITSEGVTGTAEITATLDNVSLINQAKYINGASEINADISYTVNVEANTETGTASIAIKDSGTVKLTASETTDPSQGSKTYDFEETIISGGVEYVISGKLDVENGTLRPDLAVVKGTQADFYITNEGTGDDEKLTLAELEPRNDFINNYKLKGERTNKLDTFTDHVVNAHSEGWTGKGIEIITAEESKELTQIIAPHAIVDNWENETDTDALVIKTETQKEISIGTSYDGYVHDLTDFYVSKQNTTTSTESALVAGGVALVWNKFDTLDNNQMVDLVEETTTNKQFVLANTLSPVGNLK